MEILSQRDNRWKDIKLGWSDVTIGGYGCLITCLGMMAGLNPDEVNERLKDVVGYANLNLVIWAKIKEAIPWLEFEWRGWTYDNAKVLETIEKYGSCIVEVDFDGTPRTDDMHFVLFIGNGKMYDPWTGKEEPTNKYSILRGFVVIKTKKEEFMGVSPTKEQLDSCMGDRKKFWEERDHALKKIKELEKKIKAKNRQIDGFKKLVKTTENKSKADLAKKDIECQRKIDDAKDSFNIELKRVKEGHKDEIVDLKEKIKTGEPVEVKPETQEITKKLTFKEKFFKTLELWLG